MALPLEEAAPTPSTIHSLNPNTHPLSAILNTLLKVLQQRGEIDHKEWRFLLAGPTAAPSGPGAEEPPVNPGTGWLTDKSWGEVVALSALPAFAGFDQHLVQNEDHYHDIFDSAQVGMVHVNMRSETEYGAAGALGCCLGSRWIFLTNLFT